MKLIKAYLNLLSFCIQLRLLEPSTGSLLRRFSKHRHDELNSTSHKPSLETSTTVFSLLSKITWLKGRMTYYGALFEEFLGVK